MISTDERNVAVEDHFYSVPHALVHQGVEVRTTSQTVDTCIEAGASPLIRAPSRASLTARSPSICRRLIARTWSGHRAG